METSLILMLSGLYILIIALLYKIMIVEKKVTAVGKSVGYDPAITVWKFFKQLIFGGASFVALDVLTNFSEAFQYWKPVGIIFLVALLNAINNYIKYR